jgi:hypothetical protein
MLPIIGLCQWLMLETWCLDFLWNLVLGIWSFRLSRFIGRASVKTNFSYHPSKDHLAAGLTQALRSTIQGWSFKPM